MNSKKRPAPKPTARGSSLAPGYLLSRSALAAHLVDELPGWGAWLDIAARCVRNQADDTKLLLTEKEVLQHLRGLVVQWVQSLGPDEARQLFGPLMQRHSDALHPDVDYQATGPCVAPPARNVASWPELAQIFTGRQAWPSPMIIGLIGAWGVTALDARPGARGDPRRSFAMDLVLEALGPYVEGQPKAGEPVWPERLLSVAIVLELLEPLVSAAEIAGESREDVLAREFLATRKPGEPFPPHWQVGMTIDGARRRPVTPTLMAEVVIYLSAPGPGHVEYDARSDGTRPDMDQLFTAPSALREIREKLGKRLSGCEPAS